MKYLITAAVLAAVAVPALAQTTVQKTTTNSVVEYTTSERGEVAKTDAFGNIHIKLPNGNTLVVPDTAENRWWKDTRVSHYRRFIFNPADGSYTVQEETWTETPAK